MRRSCSPAALVLLAALTVAGCKVGPDCCPWHDPLLPEWRQKLDDSLDASGAADEIWWTAFNDPQLNGLVERARAQNLSLYEAELRIREARAQRGVARAGLFPEVGQKDSYARIDISDRGSPFGITGFTFPPFNMWSTGFDMSWEIDLFGRVRRTLEAATADIFAATEGRNAVQVSVLGEVAATYVTLRTFEQRIVTAKENVRIQSETLRITQRKFDQGAVSKLEVAQATTQLHRTLAALPLMYRERDRTINRLCVLQAQQPQDLSAWLGESGPIPKPPATIAVGIPVNLVRQRPDLRRAEWEVIAQSARIGVATAELYPRFSLTGTFTLDAADITQLFTGDSIAYQVVPAARWSILNFGRVRSNIAVQQTRWEEALTRYRQAVLQAVEEVENALTAYLRTRDSEVEFSKAVASAKDAVQVAQVKFDAGTVGFQSLLDAQRELAEVQDRHQEVSGNVALSVVALYKALGGGWNWTSRPGAAIAAEPVPAPEPDQPPAPTPPAGLP
jgi:NodT family efflux transporter outer membrane factor (OMF) lipoprotein